MTEAVELVESHLHCSQQTFLQGPACGTVHHLHPTPVTGSWLWVLGAWFWVLDYWRLVLGSGLLILDFRFLVLDTWFLNLGSWFVVLGSWFSTRGSWLSIFGSEFLTLGSWSLILLDSWFLVLDSRRIPAMMPRASHSLVLLSFLDYSRYSSQRLELSDDTKVCES